MENWFFQNNSHSNLLQCIWLHLMDDSKSKKSCACLCLIFILKTGIQLGQWEQFWLDFYLSCWKIPQLMAQLKLRKKQREDMLWIRINSTFATKFLLNCFQVIISQSPAFWQNITVKGLRSKTCKVWTLWETLMVLTNQLIYFVNVKTMRKIFSNYVCFSKSPIWRFFCKYEDEIDTEALL